MKTVTVIDKAKVAKRLQENEDFKLIMDSIESDIFATFKAVDIGDSERLANVHALSHGFKLVNDRIAKYVEAGIFEARRDELSEE